MFVNDGSTATMTSAGDDASASGMRRLCPDRKAEFQRGGYGSIKSWTCPYDDTTARGIDGTSARQRRCRVHAAPGLHRRDDTTARGIDGDGIRQIGCTSGLSPCGNIYRTTPVLNTSVTLGVFVGSRSVATSARHMQPWTPLPCRDV